MTALAVTSDDATAYSVSKDGSIYRLDIESGARQALLAYSQTGLVDLILARHVRHHGHHAGGVGLFSLT